MTTMQAYGNVYKTIKAKYVYIHQHWWEVSDSLSADTDTHTFAAELEIKPEKSNVPVTRVYE